MAHLDDDDSLRRSHAPYKAVIKPSATSNAETVVPAIAQGGMVKLLQNAQALATNERKKRDGQEKSRAHLVTAETRVRSF